jgi:hypothetical protein
MGFWANLWSFLIGVGTLALAVATYAIIRQGKGQALDAERQHRDRLKPICLLKPYDGIDPRSRRRDLIATVESTLENRFAGQVEIRCVLQNVGMGPALHLRIKFWFLGKFSEPWDLAPLGAGETRGDQAAPLCFPLQSHERLNETDFAHLTEEPWDIWLEYTDVFGTEFHSIHKRIWFNQDPASWGWTTPVAGEQPKAIQPPIPWFSYHEGPTVGMPVSVPWWAVWRDFPWWKR